jgi:hypothetical protein
VVTVVGALDREATPTYTLLITATDGGSTPGALTSAQASVVVNVNDVNDVAPVVSAATLSVAENSAAATVVGTVVATDGDATSPNNVVASFAIVGGNTGNVFAISSGGVVTVVGALDREATPTYTLLITATDGGSTPGALTSAQASVVVNVNDINDVFPVGSPSTFFMLGNETAWSYIGSALAYDDDATSPNNVLSTFYVVAESDPNMFAVTSGGLVFVIDTIQKTSYTLTLRVNDSGTNPGPLLSQPFIITLNITNIALHPPIVNDATFSVPENSAAGVVVGTVTWQDDDIAYPNNVIA